MGIVFRQSAKNSIVTVAGALLGALIVWLSTGYIEKREYGFLSNFTNYAVTISQLLLIGINYTLAVYIHRFATDIRRRNLLLTWCFTIPGILSIAVGIVYFSLRHWILSHFQPADQPLMERYFIWLPLYILMFIYMVIFEQYLGTQMKVAVAAFMREVVLRIVNIALILLFAFHIISFDALVIGTVLIYLIPLCILFLLVIREKDFGLSFNFRDFTKKEYKELASFTWYHFLLTMSVLLIGSMDALLLPFYDHNGFSAAAVFRVAILLISFLQIPLKSMLTASFTVLAKAFADNDLVKAADLFLRSSINIFIATAGVALLLICNLQNIIAIINDGYSDVIPVFLILFIGNMANIATGMNDQVLSITNYYKFNLYLSLLLIAMLYLLIRTLVPIYGIFGAAWSTTITILIFNTVKCIFVWKKLGMLPFSRNTLLVIVAALPPLAAGYFFPHFFNPTRHIYVHSFLDMALRSTVIVISYMLMLVWLRPSADLDKYLLSIRENKRLF